MLKISLETINLSPVPESNDDQYSSKYRLEAEIAVGGIVTAFSGHVRHDGSAAYLGVNRDGLIVEDTRQKFGDPTLSVDLINQWRVTVQPDSAGLLPTSYMIYNLATGNDEAARVVIAEAIGNYQQQDTGF